MKRNNTFDRKKFFNDFINLDYHHKNRTFIYHEFGCMDGNKAILYYKILSKYKIRTHLYLYDGFVGMPASKGSKDKNPLFFKSNYSYPKKKLVSNLKHKKIPSEDYTIFDKNFSKLNKNDKIKIKHPKCDLAYMDADFYSSTIDALKFLRPFLTNRSILYFDNIFAYSGNPNKGELGAINHFNKVNKSCGIARYPMLDQNSGRVFTFYDNSTIDLE